MLRTALLASTAILLGGCTASGVMFGGRLLGTTVVAVAEGVGSSRPHGCTVRPHNFTTWRDPFVLPPTCPSEGWVRQIVRDIGEVDACFSQSSEVRVALDINQRGVVTRVSIAQLGSPDMRGCIAHTMLRWRFAPAARPGDLQVIYRPGGRSTAS